MTTRNHALHDRVDITVATDVAGVSRQRIYAIGDQLGAQRDPQSGRLSFDGRAVTAYAALRRARGAR